MVNVKILAVVLPIAAVLLSCSSPTRHYNPIIPIAFDRLPQRPMFVTAETPATRPAHKMRRELHATTPAGGSHHYD